jgi:hypothetical protein
MISCYFLVVIDPHRVAGEHLCQPLLDHISDVLQRGVLALDFAGEPLPQLLEVDLAQVDGEPLRLVPARGRRSDGLVLTVRPSVFRNSTRIQATMEPAATF